MMLGEFYHTLGDDGGVFLPAALLPENGDCLPLCWRLRDLPNAFCFGFLDSVPELPPEDAAALVGGLMPFTVRDGTAWFPEEMLGVLGGEKELVIVCLSSHAEVYPRSAWKRDAPSSEELTALLHELQ